MFNILLETAAVDLNGLGFAAGLLGLAAAFLMFVFVAIVAVWVYISFAYMSLARKSKQSSPGIAWIPYIGPAIIAYKSSGMHWWPWILLVGFIVPYIGGIALLVFAGFFIAWNYKLFEKVGKPGWWAILYLVPVVGLVMAGIAAWTD